MRTALIIAAALLFGQVAVPRTFNSELKLTRDHPHALTNDVVEYYQRAQVERFDTTITVTTWNPVSTSPTKFYYREESISIDASGWKELMPVIQEACGEE
jgi:hypothetical protein